MKDRDPIADALASLDAPPLDARFAARIGALAKLELRAPPAPAPTRMQLRPAFRAALVPALLSLAAIAQVATTANIVATIYGKGHVTSPQ